MGWLLRYEDRELALAPGTYLVGREKQCAIRLDDDLASRRHAELEVTPDGVVLRDLGGRNGLYYKYRRLAERESIPLASGDTFLIGRTNLVLLHQREGRPPRSGRHRFKTIQNVEATNLAIPYEKFLAEADRALAHEDFDRQAGATHLLLETLAIAIERGMPADEPAIRSATRHALGLAELRGVSWIDQLLALYEAGPLILPVEAVTTMRRLLATPEWRSERLERYVERVRPALDDAGPRGRALLAQLDAMVREQK